MRLSSHAIVIPIMRERGGGHIINISSVAEARIGSERIYCATKFALQGITKALRVELHGSGIDVSIIIPAQRRQSWRQHPTW